MKKSIATVSVSGMLPQKLAAISAARFDGVEIFENDLLQFAGTPRDVRRMAEDLGLSIDLFQPFRDFEGVGAAQLQRNLDRAERKFDLMQELGAPLMLVCSNAQPDTSADRELIAAQLRALAERAGRRGLRIGYEALAWGTHTHRFAQAWEAVKLADHPHLGLILDSFHTLVLKDDWAPIADIPGDRIFYVQLADAPWLQLDPLSHSRHYRCFPGQGEFPVVPFVGAVLEAGYTGPMSLEIFNDEFRASPARPTAADAMRSLQWLEEQVRHLPQRKPGPAQGVPHGQSHRVALLDPPPAPQLTGWSFIEFAADAVTAQRLGSFLAATGFERIGSHRSKAVDLWGQGEVRVVLNREDESFARSYFGLHGPSACAVALGTTDAPAALARAEAFGCQRVAGRVGANELTIPAVRAPDGSLVYFFDTHHGGEHGFEADFIVNPAAPGPLGEQARVDHISQVVPVGHLDTWVLFYRAVLGLQPQHSVVLNDPFGVVKSRAVESADRAVRYSMNVSERQNTAAGRSVSQFGGAGVHHIAFRVTDVLATAQALRGRGAPMLQIPDNYYDDLEARFGLEPAFLDALRRNHVLYDRTSEGEFLHCYTTPFEDRFYFEFIERRGGYTQYGAVNAPVRLAALAQLREPPQG
ncbi:MAG: bifunctional sugar phosphate isomerase/epimerase/4-hydroxyphenylpyruvate dioxygenase family protein [Ramlibacter sp.]